MAQKLIILVKGERKTAQRAAARRGIPAKCAGKTSHNGAFCEVPCSSYPKVVKWFAEKKSVKKGRGELPGALLFYGGCPKTLSGSKRRKRRRR